MKKYLRRLTALGLMTLSAYIFSPRANAQYAQIVNQLPELLSPALSGSMNYKGFVDATATFGLGENRANFVGVSTTQGFQYASWFFMGAGIGIDVAMADLDNPLPPPGWSGRMGSKTKAMIPLFTDFRFNIGSTSNISAFIDIKAGAAWLLGSDYFQLNDGFMNGRTQFLLRPSIGMRIPVNSQKPKQAINLGVTYQLLTANNNWNYWGSYQDNVTLNSIGVTAGFEW